MNVPVLSPAEQVSAMGQKILTHLEERLAIERSKLEKDMDQEQTVKQRGRIAAIKEFMGLFKPPSNPSP